MKKILCGIMAAAMAVSCCACSNGKDYSEYDTAVLEVESVKAKAGDEVELEIYLNNNPGTSTVDIELNYDTDVLTPVSMKASGDLKGQGFFYSNLSGDDELGLFTNDDNAYAHGMWFNVADFKDNGEVMVVTFEVADDAAAGDYTIEIVDNEDNLVNQDLENVEVTYLEGVVTVS